MRKILLACLTLCLTIFSVPSFADIRQVPAVQKFMHEMVVRHGFNARELNNIFRCAKFEPGIIKSMTTAKEGLPWYRYRSIFITPKRVNDGIEFWNHYEKYLNRAAAEYGVPPEIIVAIIGVETSYGSNKGKYPVIDSLSTLAFDYPPRAKFFRAELENFLLLSRDMKLNPLHMKGSYAGAIGYPQFMPSSYRRFAVDYSGSRAVDLQNDPGDAIGSVANYFLRNGWWPNKSVADRAEVFGRNYQDVKRADKYTIAELKHKYGIAVKNAPDHVKAGLVVLEAQPQTPEVWVAYHNFYVIMRYNTSKLYAMAVMQLADQLAAAHALDRNHHWGPI